MFPVVYLSQAFRSASLWSPALGRATYITAADSRVLDINDHVVIVLQLGNRAIFELDLVDALQDKGKVLPPASLANGLGVYTTDLDLPEPLR